nr:MAG TPA: chromosome segregation protein [Caudoviricetes sp.]
MMKRLSFVLIVLALTFVQRIHAQYYSVNYDARTVAAMAAAFGTEAVAESYYREQVDDILKHYTAAEVAAAGIFASKFLEHKALSDLGIWSSSTENYYYRRIYHMVAEKIMPKIWVVAKLMLRSPQTAIHWGSYLVKVCDDTKNLCMQFESIVTNSSLSFKDIAFLEINREVAALLNLSELGGIRWEQLMDNLARVPENFTKEHIAGDLDKLYEMGVGLATSGVENLGDALLQTSAFHDLIGGKISEIGNLYDHYGDLFEQAENGVGGLLLDMVGGADNVAGLFDFGNYDLTSWMTDYLDEGMGNYYTQRWYIARREQGSVALCDYYPPTDDNSILNGSAWTRFQTGDANFYPNASQREQTLANSEHHAGWSRSRVQQLNGSNDGNTYNISYRMQSYIIKKGKKQTKKAYAYEIHVTQSWNRETVVYEEVFDSYSMDLNTFKAQLNARLSEFNDNEEGYVYYIASDGRNYYQATDAGKLQGCESVTISVTCSDGATLGQGSTQYKCRKCGSSLNAHSKECVMQTTVTENELDFSELDALIQEADSRVSALESQVATLERENEDLLKKIAGASVEDAARYRQQYNANRKQIEELESELAAWRKKQQDYKAAREEAAGDNSVPTDDYYRLPAIMQDCRAAYSLTWKDGGSWNGYTFVRKATMPNINGEITFSATLSIARKPKYFLGIKIHRTIIQISWELTSSYTDTHVADVLTLDASLSDEEKTRMVNERISEIAREHPDCKITTEYARNEPMEEEPAGDVYHLLWSSDRLEIAREVDSRITKIYADLVSLEKMMHYKRSIIDVLKDVLPELDTDEGRRLTLVEECHDRWVENARASRSGRSGRKEVQP